MFFRKAKRRASRTTAKVEKDLTHSASQGATTLLENRSDERLAEILCPFCAEPLARRRANNEEPVVSACRSCLNLCLVRALEQPDQVTALSDWPDLRDYERAGSVLGAVLCELHAAIDRLPVLPEVTQKILALIHDPLSDMESLALEIERDPAISLSLLRTANSAWYGARNSETDLSRACARLGLKAVANVVWSAQSRGLFRTSRKEFSQGMQMLWQHSVVAAYCAQQLADLVPELDRDSIFLAALQHELGSAVLLSIIATSDDEKIASVRNANDRWSATVERLRRIACVHVLEVWELPRHLGTAIYFSDSPDSCPGPAARTMAHAIALSKSLAASLGYPPNKEAHYDEPSQHPSCQALGLSETNLRSLTEKMEENLGDLLSATSMVA